MGIPSPATPPVLDEWIGGLGTLPRFWTAAYEAIDD